MSRWEVVLRRTFVEEVAVDVDADSEEAAELIVAAWPANQINRLRWEIVEEDEVPHVAEVNAIEAPIAARGSVDGV